MNKNVYFEGFKNLCDGLHSTPKAVSVVQGSREYPKVYGVVLFYETKYGTLVAAEIGGLPTSQNKCEGQIFGFHIHGGESCSGTEADPFSNAGSHYDKNGCSHPHHSGDMPPLFGNNGYALSVFLTNRFSADEIIGKTVIIHSAPDDFTTQPGGNSGKKIACGEIKKY